ncbi:hypothetical protein K5Z67_000660 [Escherichia coli]|uniref:hypothetical protein n=1 Tax=Escherichia coli TaxID=562 RepID=UPI0015623836|nr:hypothetical protein [Escherichia coli]EFU8350211.1 hypothetical protein [Escherichia coli]EHP0844836.1 hypothetical protein [Escherichia coli]EIJ4879788.1 hypothetical protein [Escherichia coli]EIT3907681.1 hypothetical protein [Escherichia coli]
MQTTIYFKEKGTIMNSINTNRIFLFLIIFVICFIIFCMRRPDIISHPQLWAEDGRVWLGQAYALGPLKSIILVQDGYYQTISKLVATFSMLFPLYLSPFIFTVIALSIRCVIITFILSNRFKSVSIYPRILISIFILTMPHLEEVHANVTNTHWYMAIWLFLVLVADRTDGLYWKAHDFLVMVVAGLSGPFIVFLAPVALLRITNGDILKTPINAVKNAFRNLNLFYITFAIVCLIQIAAILLSSKGSRPTAPLGAGVGILMDILSSRVFLGSFLSESLSRKVWDLHALNYFVSLCGLSISAYVLLKGNWKEKALVIFPYLMLGFALARPVIARDQPQWPLLQIGPGQRYFVIPAIFWVSILLAFTNMLHGHVKKLAFCIVACSVILSGIVSFKIEKRPNNGWVQEAYKYETAAPGSRVKMHTLPHSGWYLDIIKK